MPRKFEQSERTRDFRNVDEEDCDDPTNTLSVPEADSNAIMLVNVPSPPMRDEVDADVNEGTDNKCEQGTGEDDDLSQDWNPSLYMLQARAPKAKCVKADKKIVVSPSYYELEYHGYLNRQETESLLGVEDGAYLVRDTLSGVKILSFMMNKRMFNYRLYYEDGQHYVGENHFEDIDDLVQDNLITLYLQQHNVAQTMHEGQIMSIARRKTAQKKLHGLQRAHGRRVKGLKGKKAWEYQQTISASSIKTISSPSPTPSPTLSPTPSPKRSFLNMDETMSDLDHQGHGASKPDELDLDLQNGVTKRLSSSTPNYVRPLKGTKRNDSTSSLPMLETCSDRYSVIISTLREAINDDKRKEHLKLDKSNTRLKPCSSEGRIGLSATLKSEKVHVQENDDRPSRAYSCHIPYFTSLDKITDVALKGTNAFSKSSMDALAKHTSGPSSPYFKAHNFAPHTYIGPTWCEVCHHFLWGVKHQGLRCKDCGMDIHKQCLPLCLRLECYPNKQFVKRVFGVDLTTLVKLEGKVVPNILNVCVTEIESRENDLSSTGIYRLSGQTSEIVILKEKFDAGEQIDFSQYLDISILTGAVKLYLRELPIPLITFDAYHEVIKATTSIEDPEDTNFEWTLLVNALKLLPKAHYNTLKFLTKHLYKIHLKASENKMNAQNLAVVFAPTLMKSPCEDGSLIHDLPLQRNLIEYLILFHDSIFK